MNKIKKINKNGFAIIWSTLIVFIFTIIATSMVILISKELKITANIDESNRAYLAAEAGMERALYILKQNQEAEFGWCEDISGVTRDLDSAAETKLSYVINIDSTKTAGSSENCQEIKIESTGVDKDYTNRKLQLRIVYGPQNNIERYDQEPNWYSPTNHYYYQPGASTLFSTVTPMPLLIQQFDIWELNRLSNGKSLVIGINGHSANDDFGIRFRKNGGEIQFSLTGKINGQDLVSNTQSFIPPAYDPDDLSSSKNRVVIEYSKLNGNYSVVRAIVLKGSLSPAGEERFFCIGNNDSYVVYASTNSVGFTPSYVKLATFPAIEPNIDYPAWVPPDIGINGNGYLEYPGNGGTVKLDNMVFWGRQ